MTAQAYYRHARALGAFPAHEALRLARVAAALDDARPVAPPSLASVELLPDGTAPVRLSFAVKVF